MKRITIYSKDNCPACVLLKTKMKALGMEFIEVNISQDEQSRQWLIEQGHKSVPQVYVDGKYSGTSIPTL